MVVLLLPSVNAVVVVVVVVAVAHEETPTSPDPPYASERSIL